MAASAMQQRVRTIIGIVLGGGLLATGVISVLVVDFNPLPPPPERMVRPVKTARVVNADAVPERRFRGQVMAGRTVDLSFQVGGPLTMAQLDLGRRLNQGDLLARIDPTRYEQRVNALQPAVEQARQKLERIKELARTKTAPQKDLDEAQAAYDLAVAELAIAQQAVKDTTLVAPFPALVVKSFVNNFQNVQPGEPVARLMDISTLDLAVDLPESVVALHKKRENVTMRAVFSVRPEPTYEVALREASAEADPQTGTYRVVFTMPALTDINILPGMAVTLVSAGSAATQSLAVPLASLRVDEQGKKSVWKLEADGEGHSVREVPVTVERLQGQDAIIASDLKESDEVVAAGVGFLREGRRVRPMETRP